MDGLYFSLGGLSRLLEIYALAAPYLLGRATIRGLGTTLKHIAVQLLGSGAAILAVVLLHLYFKSLATR